MVCQCIRYSTVSSTRKSQIYFGIKANCGDRVVSDDDVGHNSTTIGICPKIFNRGDAYHVVYFRWYLNETAWNDCKAGTVFAYISAYDWNYDAASAVAMQVLTCIGCGPNGTPSPPFLTGATYEQTSTVPGTIRLSWTNSDAKVYI